MIKDVNPQFVDDFVDVMTKFESNLLVLDFLDDVVSNRKQNIAFYTF